MQALRYGLAIAMLAAATAAHAGDGRIEINQVCATQTGCGTNDAEGFPVATTAATSYVLTSDLTLPSATSEGIRLARGSSLDMNGFSIVGPTTCTGSPAVCTGTGQNGMGIYIPDGYVTIRNGRVAGAGDRGIYGNATGSLIENVVAEFNGNDGFNLSGAGFQIVRCVAQANGQDGFFSAYQSSAANLYHGNVARGNGDDGFDVSGVLLLDNVAAENLDYGMNANYQDTDSAWGRNFFRDNNGGGANPQAAGGDQIGANVCGTATCPP